MRCQWVQNKLRRLSMKGYIDKISKEQVKGWISDGSASPLHVALYINGKKRRSKIADEMRPRVLASKQHPTGACGFSFNIKKLNIDPKNDKVEVKVEQGIPLSNQMQKQRIRQQRNSKLKGKNVFFFIHIPKTAGTSLRNMLYQQFDQNNIYPNQADIDQNQGRYPKNPEVLQEITNRFDSLELFGGHYTYNVGDTLLGKKMIPLVFFRDPIERCISLLYQMKRMIPEYRNQSLSFILDKEPNQVQNVQTYYMTGAVPPVRIGESHLAKAKERIAALPVFGISESFSESVEKFENVHGWTLGSEKKLNRNPVKKPDLDQSLINKLSELNRFDIELYTFAVERFKEL